MIKKGKKVRIFVFALLMFSLNLSVSASNISLYFFYGEGCIYCKIIEPTVKEACKQYNLSFKSYEIYHNVTNSALLRDFEKRFCIPPDKLGIPVVFVGDSALIGADAIAKNLKNAIENAKEKNIHAETYKKDCVIYQPMEITIIAVIIAAIIDSINPCAIGVLGIFIMFMMYSVKFPTRKIAIYGSIYIFFVFITYFLAGLGTLKFIHFIYDLGFIIFINIFVIAILLIGAFLAFRDMYISLKKDKKKLYLVIPSSAKETIEKYIKKGTLLSVIILGIFVAMAELPCTGYVYFGILNILSTIDFNYGVLLLAIYNLIFVFPLILILSLALYRKNLEIFKTKTESSWLVRYLIGWLMITLAIIIINETLKILNFNIKLNVAFSYTEFFIIAAVLIIIFFIIFSILRPIVKKKINIWYCAYCYACALTWLFLIALYMLNVNVPKILIAALIGMSLAGIWEEFKKFNFRYFGLFTIFMIIFGMSLIYALFIDHKLEFLLLLLIIFVMDGIIILKNFETRKEELKEKMSLREMLDRCCD